MLEGAVHDRLKQIIEQVVEENHWSIESLAIQPDHVHLFIQSNPYTLPTDIARLIKGRSSHDLRVIAVAPNFTSQDCSACGARVKKSLSVRTHVCHACGVVLDRDHNAALNIVGKGLCTVGQTGTARASTPSQHFWTEDPYSHIERCVEQVGWWKEEFPVFISGEVSINDSGRPLIGATCSTQCSQQRFWHYSMKVIIFRLQGAIDPSVMPPSMIWRTTAGNAFSASQTCYRYRLVRDCLALRRSWGDAFKDDGATLVAAFGSHVDVQSAL